MIIINIHLLAILPLLLFSIATAVRYSFFSSTRDKIHDEYVIAKLREDFLFSFVIETIILATINGIIMAELSGDFGAGTGFLLAGIFLGILILSLLRNGYEDLSEYFIAILGLLFLYEFVYFLSAGSYANVLGFTMVGWQIAVAWYFGFIGVCIGAFILIVWMRSRQE